MRKPVIAVDGPAGSGKSTVARLVAQRLGLLCVETGAMYRAVAWQALHEGVALDDAEALAAMTARVDLQARAEPDGRMRVIIGGRDVTDHLRSPRLEHPASLVSAHPQVRQRLVAIQRRIARAGGVIMEGRDIQTVVLPDADLKVFLTASLPERVRRRVKDLEAAGLPADPDQVRRQIEDRDHRDQTRAASPLRPARDAIVINTDDMTVDQVVEAVLAAAAG